MKKYFILLMIVAFTVSGLAQPPQKMSYQAVIRNSSGALVVNHSIGIKVSILQGSATGTVVYSETYSPAPQANANGLVTVEIGSGTPSTGTFSYINWSNGPYFLKTEVDPSGGTSYTIVGTSQLLSVPYSLHSKSTETYSETDPVFGASPAKTITSSSITNWNTAYGWGNHAGLYRPNTYITAWGEVTGKPAGFADGVDNVDDADNDITNEIQALSISSSNLSLSKGGGTVAIPGDNWGIQAVVTDAAMTGNGTTAAPLKIADNGITSAKIQDGTIVVADLANNSVTTEKIADGTIVNADIADNGIGSSKIQDASVGTADIAGSAITTALIANNAVTVTKLPPGATSDKYLRGDGTWATPTAGITTETDPTWSGAANETVATGRTGNVGIGTTTPAALLHTYGTGVGGGNVVFIGEQKNSGFGNPPVTGYGTRMMWYPDKAAFRAGFVEGSHWDASVIGHFSAAFGRNTKASSYDALAAGVYSIASGQASTALGYGTIATSVASTALGEFNIGGGNPDFWVSTDPLFEIGNGGGTPVQRHNALTVLKNGYVGFGTASPAAGLHIKANGWPGSFIYLEASTAQDAGFRFYEGTTPKWHIYNNFVLGGLQITNAAAGTAIFAKQSNAFVGIGTSSPAYTLDVAGAVNLTKGLTGAALLCNGSQAIWYDGTYFSWGYQGTYNYFANKVTIGSPYLPGYMLYVQGNAYTTGTWGGSDVRFKKSITPLSNVLEKIMKVRGTSFEFRRDEFKDYQFDEGTRFGFIAQELEEIFPEVVKTEDNGYKSVNYDGMIPVLLESIKEQQLQIESQQKQIDELKQLVQVLMEK